jgi:hypothetical protein
VKLSAKFARQETEETRLARIARRRIRGDQAAAVRRMLGLPAEEPRPAARRSRGQAGGAERLACPHCPRQFALPMHLGRHVQARHGPTNAV